MRRGDLGFPAAGRGGAAADSPYGHRQVASSVAHRREDVEPPVPRRWGPLLRWQLAAMECHGCVGSD
jgi:hypothetical protein